VAVKGTGRPEFTLALVKQLYAQGLALRRMDGLAALGFDALMHAP
jgi:hypothetical protein